jgi:hypothetical protein
MPNLTLSISEDLQNRMREHSEIRWSEVVRKSISEKIEDLDLMNKLTKKSKFTEKDAIMISKKIDSSVAKKLGLK